MKKQTLKIGLIGFGCVGQGLYDVLNKTNGVKATIYRICVKDRNKPRTVESSLITYDRKDLLNDPKIDVIVELINDADVAFEIVKEAFKKGKGVVSANKKMIAEHFVELLALQKKYKLPFLYEASSCASIPIIRNLEEYYDNDLLSGVEGIFNGSTNYILSKMYAEARQYFDVLTEAQKLGFAESNPDLDVKGFDPKYKLAIIVSHAFGVHLPPQQILNLGIHNISKADIDYAKQNGLKIKLVSFAKRIENKLIAIVAPKFISSKNKLFLVEDEYNAVVLEGAFSDEQFFLGKGAGSYPTGSAVLSDISALTYGYKYEYKKIVQNRDLKFTNDVVVEVYIRYSDESLFTQVSFDSIKVKHISKAINYVVARISIKELFKLNKVNDQQLFIALTQENVFELEQMVDQAKIPLGIVVA